MLNALAAPLGLDEKRSADERSGGNEKLSNTLLDGNKLDAVARARGPRQSTSASHSAFIRLVAHPRGPRGGNAAGGVAEPADRATAASRFACRD